MPDPLTDVPPPSTPPSSAPAAVSPTGQALLPPKLVPYAIALVSLAGGLLAAPELGVALPAWLKTTAAVIVFIVAPALGLASPGLRKAAPMLLLVLGLGLSSCATTSAAATVNVATSSLDATGKLFLTTAAALDAAYDAKLVSELQYQPWRDFSLRFKAAYAIADKALAAAAQSNDETVQGVVQAEMDTLSRELGTFQALAAQVAHPTTGPPAGFRPVSRPLRLLAAGGEL